MTPLARRRGLAGLLTPLLLCSASCAIHTEPFRDQRGRPLAGSVAVMTDVTLGGVAQRVWFRGASIANPAVIVLHGGPGASEAALFRHYNAALEQSFLMVHWEQRGTGRSFHASIPPASMTMDQFVRDLDELVALVRVRFHKDRVVLLGHSWGSALGLEYIARHPAAVAAFVGVGQVADMREGERLSYDFAVDEAARRGDRRAQRELARIGPPPHTVDDMLTSRKWVARFGGSFHARLSTGGLIWAALRTDEANLIDLVRFGRGNRFSLQHLWPVFRRFDADDRLLRFEVPIAFLLGRYDRQVPATLAARYFERIAAPAKQLVWFEHSAHNPPFEEPARFNEVLADTLAALGSAASSSQRLR